jgi:hypothetical protein
MLDETPQQELAMITPRGTNDTSNQKALHGTIEQQKQDLDQLLHKPLGEPVPQTRREWERAISSFLAELKIDRYGVSAILPEYVFPSAKIQTMETRAIVLVVPMNYRQMQSVPSHASATQILTAYSRVGHAVLELTSYLRQQGIQATGHHPLGDQQERHVLLFPPHAVAAGLGEKGRPGLFIDHQLGPLVRLGIVTTSLQLPINSTIDRGISAFCQRCRYCAIKCPPRAVNTQKYLESLHQSHPMNFSIDAPKCFKHFEQHFGCAICIVHCVLAQPNETEIAKRIKRIEKWYHRCVVSGELAQLQKNFS